MSLTVLCSVILAFYVVIWFFDSFFKSCMHYPYYAFLKGTGLKVGILHFSWTTTAFNRPIYRWSKNLSRFLRKWFTVGHIITIYLFLPFSIWTLVSFITHNFYGYTQIASSADIKTMLPGVNIPTSDFWAYFLSLGLSSIIHELGHALAAAQEDVQLLTIGFSVFAIIPFAFVELNTESLSNIPVNKRLRIYCAGVWHNIACAFITLLVFFSTPMLFSIGYVSDIGVRVTGFTHDSPLQYSRGLDIKDVIIKINECEVKDMKDWSFCLHMAYERYGICTTSEFIAQNDEIMMESFKENDVVECCRPEDTHNFCFEYMEPKVAGESTLPGQYSCLKPRAMVQDKLRKCTESGGYMCPRNMHCLKPSLHNNTYLMVIERRDMKPVLYLGLPYDLHVTVLVDQYFPRNSMFALFSPKQFERVLYYLFVFSMGLGFLNVIPCYGTDGQHIARNIIQIVAKYLNKDSEFVNFASLLTVFISTAVTVPTLLYLFFDAISSET